uniref:Alpha-coixin 17 kDa n=1 Tax=Coix lacryma-jobi TaxID=4505 RepID=Q42401_COILA|nr:alpha-coixin 17 kDA [Coix lacryma-jobi]CAA56257.1 beta-coixin [Coix lacryma-jobi]
MKMVIVLAVCLALSAAASASALQMPFLAGLQGLYGAGDLMTTTMMMGAGGGLYPCAEYLRQPQCSCSPVAVPYYAQQREQMTMCQQMRMMGMQSRCGAMCGVAQQSVAQQLQMMMQLQGTAAAASSGLLYEPALMQQLLPAVAAQAALTNPMAMAVAQAAQNMPAAMCGLYQQLPSYCGTTPSCAVSAAIPPYY